MRERANRTARVDRRLQALGVLGLLFAMYLLARTHVRLIEQQYRLPSGTGVRIDVNRADAATLALLDQIGPERARRIVEWRDRNGPFRSFPDLMRVSGIGPATVEGLVGKICFGP